MRITAIKAQVKNPDRVSVFVDGKYSFSLSLNELLSEKLKTKQEITDVDLKSLKKLSDEGKIRQRMVEWLFRRPHSVRELNDYLYRKKIDKDLAESLVEYAKSKDYVNDNKFAVWFIEQRQRKNKSKREITSELLSKGVSLEQIDEAFSANEHDESVALATLVKKLKTRSRYQDDKKLISYLLSKGFNYQDIKKTIDN